MFDQIDVVGIKERDIPAPREIDAEARRGTAAAIGLGAKADARIGKRFHDRARIVARTVIAEDDLDILTALREHGTDRVAHDVGAVVNRNDHGEERVHGAGSTSGARRKASIKRHATQAGASPSRKSDSRNYAAR